MKNHWYRQYKAVMESISLVDMGYMDHATDIDGLQRYLKSNNIIPQNGTILNMHDFEELDQDSEEKHRLYGGDPIYGYYVNKNERGEFYADVRDESGDSIYDVKSEEPDDHDFDFDGEQPDFDQYDDDEIEEEVLPDMHTDGMINHIGDTNFADAIADARAEVAAGAKSGFAAKKAAHKFNVPMKDILNALGGELDEAVSPLIRLQYKAQPNSITWKNSSLTMRTEGLDNMVKTAKALKVQEGWSSWRIVVDGTGEPLYNEEDDML